MTRNNSTKNSTQRDSQFIFTHPFLALRSLSPHSTITNLHIFLPSPTPSCQWLDDGYPNPIDIFCHGGKVKNFSHFIRNVAFFMDWKSPGHLASRTEILRGHRGTNPGNVPGKLEQVWSLVTWLLTGGYRKQWSDFQTPVKRYLPYPEIQGGHEQQLRCYAMMNTQTGNINTLRTGSFKLFKRPFPGFLTILTL